MLFCFLCFVCVCHTVLSVPCSILFTCWERADLLVLLFVMFSFFCLFPILCSGSGLQYVIVVFPDHSHLLFFNMKATLLWVPLHNVSKYVYH